MARLDQLVEAFSDTTNNSNLWTPFATGTATQARSNGQVVFTPPASTAGSNYGGYDSAGAGLDLTGSYGFVQIVQAVNAAVGAQQYFKLTLDASNSVLWILENGILKPQKTVVGATSDLTAGVTFNSTTHAWWRIRTNQGTMYFDFTSDPLVGWTNNFNVTNPIAVTSLSVELAAGTYQSVVSPGAGIFDNFNFTQQKLITTYQPGLTWTRRFVKNKRQVFSWPQVIGRDDIPQQMNISTFRPGRTWTRRYGRNQRQIFWTAPNANPVDPQSPNPTASSLVISGLISVLNLNIPVSQQDLTIALQTPVTGLQLNPTPQALTIASNSSILNNNIAVSPASLTLSGQSSVLGMNIPVSPQSVILSGQIPTVSASAGVSVTPSNATLSLTGQTSVLNTNISVSQQIVVVSGQTSVIGTTVPVSSQALTASGQSSSLAFTIAVNQAILNLAGQTSTVSITANNSLNPTPQTLTLSGFTPDVNNGTISNIIYSRTLLGVGQ